MILLIENQSFTCVNLIKTSNICKTIALEQFETYQKSSFRNRYIIVGANGVNMLTVPLLGGRNQHTPIREVKIDKKESWQKLHWKAITSAYNKSPWFEHYKQSLHQLFIKPYTFLYDFNWDGWKWCLEQLKCNIQLIETQTWQKQYSENEFLDKRNFWMPKNYNTVSEQLIKYHQVFEDKLGFIYNVSILDLLFCEGPNAITILNAK